MIVRANHQYVRAYGSLNYVEAIAKFHERKYRAIDPKKQVMTVNGGVEGLFCSILGIVNPDDEVIQFDPSFDCYRGQVQAAGGKVIGLPLRPRQQASIQNNSAIKAKLKGKMQKWVLFWGTGLMGY